MRKVRLASFISIDGVIQAPGGPTEDPTGGFAYGGWIVPYFDEAGGELMDEAMGTDYDLLLGRRTYEIFAAYWPYQGDAMGELFDRINKYVAAGPETALDWTGSHRLEGDVADAVRKLKATEGRDLLIQGSSQVVQALLAADLIDELVTLTFPIILGKGKRLFDSDARPGEWMLVKTQHSPTGAVVNTYHRVGHDVQVGTFAADNPSAPELARRARWAAGES